jgi:hypothetical protein
MGWTIWSDTLEFDGYGANGAMVPWRDWNRGKGAPEGEIQPGRASIGEAMFWDRCMLGNRFLIQLLSTHPACELTSSGRAPQLPGPIGVPGSRFRSASRSIEIRLTRSRR